MKKILYSSIALTLTLAVALPMAESAATFSFSPSAGAFEPGETFSVVVYVNPSAGEEITTAQLSATFPASVLEVVSFTQADGWMPLVAPGSDLINNTAGKLIKTAGFPERVTASKQFGTIKLRAKNAGTATINTEGDSMLLDITNTDRYVASAGASFIVAIPTLPPIPTPTPETTNQAPAPAVPTEEGLVEEPEEPVVTTPVVTTQEETEDPQKGQVAAIAAVIGEAGIVYYALAILALLMGMFAWRKWGKGSKS